MTTSAPDDPATPYATLTGARMLADTDGWRPGWVAADGVDPVEIDYRVHDGRIQMRRREAIDEARTP